ncbi:aspartate aminotransferase family protein [Thermodesulfobacteriota bacterium]
MSNNDKELLKWDADHLMHWVAPIGQNAGIIMDRAEGISFFDTQGKEYIDGASQLVCVSLGYKYNEEIAEAAAEQLKKMPYMHNFWGFTNTASLDCGQKLADITPGGLDHFCFTNGGSEAVEIAFQLARKYWRLQGTNKHKIISLYNSYHGVMYGSVTATGLAMGLFSQDFAPLVPGFIKAPSYYCYRCMLGKQYPDCGIECAKNIEKIIQLEGPQNMAAMIAEPVHGTAGHIPPPPEYWPMVREICDKYDVLLIADEVMTGFGRAGKAFALEHWGVKPDMMTMAKGITSSFVPCGAVAMSDKVYDGFKGAMVAGQTFSSHVLAAAVSSKVLEIYKRDKIFENAAEMGNYAMDRFRNEFLDLPCVGEVSGLGLMIGIEIVEDKEAHRGFDPDSNRMLDIQQALYDKGLFLRVSDQHWSSANRISFCPPLTVTREEVDRIIDILQPVVAEVKPG